MPRASLARERGDAPVRFVAGVVSGPSPDSTRLAYGWAISVEYSLRRYRISPSMATIAMTQYTPH